MESPYLLEADHSSLVIGWAVSGTSGAYELQMASSPHSEPVALHDLEWKTLSDKLQSNVIRKKNLVPDVGYRFRVRRGREEFSDVSAEFEVLAAHVKQLEPPTLLARDGNSVTIQWHDEPGSKGYQIRYRDDSAGSQWHYVEAVISKNSAKKKGLHAGLTYFFSVRPADSEGSYEYSLSSAGFTVAAVSDFMRALLPPSLICKSGLTSTESAIAGKVVGIYFSAHWCGPCRQFTPMLAAAYQQAKAAGKPFEVIFCSADHSEKEFEGYYSSMPWLAIAFGEEQREELMTKFRVSGIPMLSILAPSGKFIAENAAGRPISMDMIDSWVASAGL